MALYLTKLGLTITLFFVRSVLLCCKNAKNKFQKADNNGPDVRVCEPNNGRKLTTDRNKNINSPI